MERERCRLAISLRDMVSGNEQTPGRSRRAFCAVPGHASNRERWGYALLAFLCLACFLLLGSLGDGLFLSGLTYQFAAVHAGVRVSKMANAGSTCLGILGKTRTSRSMVRASAPGLTPAYMHPN